MGSRYGLLVKVQLAILLGRDLGFDFAHRQGPPIWVVVKIRVLLGTLNSRGHNFDNHTYTVCIRQPQLLKLLDNLFVVLGFLVLTGVAYRDVTFSV